MCVCVPHLDCKCSTCTCRFSVCSTCSSSDLCSFLLWLWDSSSWMHTNIQAYMLNNMIQKCYSTVLYLHQWLAGLTGYLHILKLNFSKREKYDHYHGNRHLQIRAIVKNDKCDKFMRFHNSEFSLNSNFNQNGSLSFLSPYYSDVLITFKDIFVKFVLK